MCELHYPQIEVFLFVYADDAADNRKPQSLVKHHQWNNELRVIVWLTGKGVKV